MSKKTAGIVLIVALTTVLAASLGYYLLSQPNQTHNYPSPTPTPSPTPPDSTSTPNPSATPTSEPLATPEPTTSQTQSPTTTPTPTQTSSTDTILVDYWETARTINDDTMTVWVKYTLRLRGYSSVNINIAEICLNGTYYPTNESSDYYTLTADENLTSNALSYELPINCTYIPMYYSEFLNFEFSAITSGK
jgi:hypothetical protein